MKPPEQNTRYTGVRKLSQSLNMVTNPIFRKRGFIENKIITDWHIIVGESLSDYSAPRKLVFAKDQQTNGVLHIEISNSGMAMELTYMEPVIIEKIACYFGYKAIAKLKIIQKPAIYKAKNIAPPPPRVLSEASANLLSEQLKDIDDEDLRSALESLGKSVLH